MQQQRPESPTVTLSCHACKHKVLQFHQRDMYWWIFTRETCTGGFSPERHVLVDFHQRDMYWWISCTLYLHACQVRVTIGLCLFQIVKNNNYINDHFEWLSFFFFFFLLLFFFQVKAVLTRPAPDIYRQRYVRLCVCLLIDMNRK